MALLARVPAPLPQAHPEKRCSQTRMTRLIWCRVFTCIHGNPTEAGSTKEGFYLRQTRARALHRADGPAGDEVFAGWLPARTLAASTLHPRRASLPVESSACTAYLPPPPTRGQPRRRGRTRA